VGRRAASVVERGGPSLGGLRLRRRQRCLIRGGLAWASAREWVRVARALRGLPAIARSHAEGRLSFDQLRRLTRSLPGEDEAWAACAEMEDYRRASEWTEATERWPGRHSITGFPGICRVHRAEISRLRGARLDAERFAREASQELEHFGVLVFVGDALYEVGEIRLRRGDLVGAEEAFRQAHEVDANPPARDGIASADGRQRGRCAFVHRTGTGGDDAAPGPSPAAAGLRRDRPCGGRRGGGPPRR
jgi:hypothetical protein